MPTATPLAVHVAPAAPSPCMIESDIQGNNNLDRAQEPAVVDGVGFQSRGVARQLGIYGIVRSAFGDSKSGTPSLLAFALFTARDAEDFCPIFSTKPIVTETPRFETFIGKAGFLMRTTAANRVEESKTVKIQIEMVGG